LNNEKIKGYIISEDVVTSTPKIVSDKSGCPTVIETILQEGDVQNRNKRIYPTDVIRKALTSEYVQERLNTKSWVGEAGKWGLPNYMVTYNSLISLIAGSIVMINQHHNFYVQRLKNQNWFLMRNI